MMIKHMIFGLGFALMLGVMFLVNPGSAAGNIFRLTLSSAHLIQCGGNIIEAAYTLSAYDDTGAVIGNFGGKEVYVTTNGIVQPPATVFTSGQSHTFYLAVGSGTMTFAEVYVISTDDPVVRSETFRINCDGTIQNLGGAKTAADRVIADDRLNSSNGDLVSVLYARTGASGQQGISVYSVNASSQGVFQGHFAYDLFAPYLNNPPAANVFLGQVHQSSLYALTSGEFQINITDPHEFKTYTIIFSAFPVSSVYYR